jgi:hypothetical protein
MGVSSRIIYDQAIAELREAVRYKFILKIITVACLLTLPVWMSALFFSSPWDYSYTASMVWVPLILIACLFSFSHLWRRNPYLRQLLGAGILARVAFTGLYLWMGFHLYNAAVDAFHYWTVGKSLANSYSFIGWSAFKPPYWNTNLINNICGILMLVTRDALPALFLLFALSALWGGFFFYRAFEIAFPHGDTKLFGLFALLLPSILFWSSAIGKDGPAQLFIGISCYGYARWSRNPKAVAGIICVFGVAGMACIRPHIGAMLALAMVMPYAFAKSKGGWMNKSAKILIIPAVFAATFMLVRQAGEFVGVESGSAQAGVDRANTLTANTQIGGSAFNSGGSLLVRIAESPVLIFRPFPWEIHNVTTLLSSIEATGLLIFCWRRRREFKALSQQWRQPYVMFLLFYTVLFSVSFAAATSNFGILVRQRIMLLPMYLMLFCAIPSNVKDEPSQSMRRIKSLRLPPSGVSKA